MFDGTTPTGSPAINIPSAGSNPGDNGSGGNSNNSQPIDITYQRQQSIFNNSRFRRESIAHSHGMGGVSWGSVTIGSWLKDEVMTNSGNFGNNFTQPQSHQQSHQQQQQQQQSQQNNQFLTVNQASNQNLINPRRGSFRHNNNLASISMSPPLQTSYLPELEADYCKDYSCCGELLPTLHDLLRHYEEAHISPSPPPDHNINRNNRNSFNNIHNVLETVSTTDVFLNNTNTNPNNQSSHPSHTNNYQFQPNQSHNQLHSPQAQQISNPSLNLHNNHYNIQPQALNANPSNTLHNNNSHMGNNNNNNNSNSNNTNPSQLHQQQQQQSPIMNSPSSGTPMEEDDGMYIDDPARHLYVMESDEHKPFKCPVIGCDKNYKNQNGLKYHRLHGHQGQTLKENPDGTISVIDPESNAPYLDGAAMEKDKPYRCEVCGKRYKNLNGLKYHRGHTTH
ncbi:split zinc finger protein [Scheffersomyces coipomensis]|uniref:split zinc finger protein n=1 Tax=Scheffersomyces coipomensis TaxID=1788519 RepID=UPI00315D31B6